MQQSNHDAELRRSADHRRYVLDPGHEQPDHAVRPHQALQPQPARPREVGALSLPYSYRRVGVRRPRAGHCRRMLKRSVATVGWFFATWCMWELLAYFTGWPRLVGPVLATAAAATIGFDPMRAIWSPRDGTDRPHEPVNL